MNSRILFIVLAVAAIAGAGFVLSGGESNDAPTPFGSETRTEDDPRERSDEFGSTNETRQRTEADTEGTVSADAIQMSNKLDARLAMMGRVVNGAGAPVPGANISLFFRRDPRAMFDRFRGGPPGRGRGGRGGFDWDEMRKLFEFQQAEEVVTTAADGTFALKADAFSQSSLELAVDHTRFAPAVVQRSWNKEDGAVMLEDIVLQEGITVQGVVVTDGGNPVPSATVSYRSSDRGRGRRGGFGGGGDDRVQDMLGDVLADATGRFTFDRIPPGAFTLRAEAPLHVPGNSERLTAQIDSPELDAGAIQLGPGAEIRGIVVDRAGTPIVGARVSGMRSREDNGGDGDDQAARMARAFRGGRGGGASQSTETDEDGTFHLDMIPAGPVRIEVRHAEFVDADIDPVYPTQQPNLEVTMDVRPILAGVVLDAETGEPVTRYSIRARRTRGDFDFARMMTRGRNGGEPDPEALARMAEREAEREREDNWRTQRLGGTGEIPRGDEDDIESHPDGRFRLENLNPGEYVVDIIAPGHVNLAAGPITLEVGPPQEGIEFRVERGTTLKGVVVDGRTGQPVAGADVALAVPPVDGASAQPTQDMFSMFRGRGGRGGGRDTVQSVETDEQGRFEIGPWRAGPWILTVEADNYPGFRDASFTLQNAPREQQARITMDPGATVYGLVHGVEEGSRATLSFTHAETGERRTTRLDRNSSEYQIEGLPSGGWFVSIEERNGNNDGGRRGGADFRSRIGNALATQTGAAPDVIVPPGGEVRYDIGADSVELPSVVGKIFKNGGPGAGLEARLVLQEDPAMVTGDERAARFMRGGLSRFLRDGANAETGEFEIESVPPGNYILEIHRSSGGRGGRGGRGGGPTLRFGGNEGGALYSEPLSVQKGANPERFIEIATGSAKIQLVANDGEAVQRTRVTIVDATEAGDRPASEWRGLDSAFSVNVRDGVAEISDAKPGQYRFSISGRGIIAVTGDLSIAASNQPTELTVAVERDPNAEQQPAGGGPGGQRGGGPGGQRGGGAGGQRGGGGGRGGNRGGNRGGR